MNPPALLSVSSILSDINLLLEIGLILFPVVFLIAQLCACFFASRTVTRLIPVFTYLILSSVTGGISALIGMNWYSLVLGVSLLCGSIGLVLGWVIFGVTCLIRR